MRNFIAVAVAALLATVAQAQPTATVTNGVAWEITPGSVTWDVWLTTNKTYISTNGYVPPASAIIAFKSTPTNQIAITNLWFPITNGMFSVFVQGRNAQGISSITSTNFIFNMVIPPLPAFNLHLQ